MLARYHAAFTCHSLIRMERCAASNLGVHTPIHTYIGRCMFLLQPQEGGWWHRHTKRTN